MAGLFACTLCAVVAGGVALYGAYSMSRNLARGNYRAAAWDAVGLATFGWGRRAASSYRYSIRMRNMWRARAVVHRTKAYRLNSYRFALRAKRYSRHMRYARYADYGHSTLSASYSYRNAY